MSLMRSFGSVTDGRKELITLLVALVAALGSGVAVSYLVATGRWPIALAFLMALPAFVLLHRYPFAALIIWLLITPFLIGTHSTMLRQVYWAIHRALPPATLAVMVFSSALGIHRRRFPKLGWPEFAMAGYVVVSLLSVLYLNDDVSRTTIILYDRVVVPMCLYLLVRLTRSDEDDLKRLLPVLAFVLLSQTFIGILSWTAPQLLPTEWLDRAGTRTTGSVQSYSVFTATVVFCGLLLLHGAIYQKLSTKVRQIFMVLFVLAMFMVFFSFSRGSWLAGIIVISVLFLLHPKPLLRLALTTVTVLFLLLSSGIWADEIQYASERFYSDQSEQSALSRLPVIYASYRMFETKPIFGWGFENFDKYDFQFQERVGDLVTPEKDHTSHNVYFTLLAEQGMTGFFLYLAPMFWWLAMSIKAFPRLAAEGFWSRRLLVIFWLVIVFHIIVNNFSNMTIVFGVGMWWVTLGFIARLTDSSAQSHGRVNE